MKRTVEEGGSPSQLQQEDPLKQLQELFRKAKSDIEAGKEKSAAISEFKFKSNLIIVGLQNEGRPELADKVKLEMNKAILNLDVSVHKEAKVREELKPLLGAAKVFAERLDYDSAHNLRLKYEQLLKDKSGLKNEAKSAVLEYLKGANPDLFADFAEFDPLLLETDVKAAEDMLGGMNAWMADIRRSPADFRQLADAFKSGDATWLRNNGFSPKMLENQFLPALALRQYAVSSNQELHSVLTAGDNVSVLARPSSAGLAGLLELYSGCFDVMEKTFLGTYRADSKYYNPKFESLDLFGKYFFLSRTLGWISQKSTDAKETVNVILTDSNLLTPAGQLGYLGKAMPMILAYFPEADRISGISNALRGTAIRYGLAYDFVANGQKEYFGEVATRVSRAFMDYLENVRKDIFIGGVENELPIKVLDPGERLVATMSTAGVYPQSINFFPFQNVMLQAYLDATMNTRQYGIGEPTPYGSPRGTIDSFFRPGIAEMIPVAPTPRKEDWYGPPFDSLLRELTRVDLTRHYASQFSVLDGSTFVSEDEYKADKKSNYAFTVNQYGLLSGPRGSASAFYSRTRQNEQSQTQLTLAGNDLSNGENWTVKSISANWSKGVGSESLSAQLDTYAGKDANLLLFMQNDYGSEQYLVRAYVRKGNSWARFFSQRLGKEDLKRQYGRVFAGFADVEASLEQDKLAGAVVGVNLSSLGIPSGTVAGAATPRAVFGKGLQDIKNDFGAGSYLLLGQSSDPRSQPAVFARFTRVSERDVAGATFVSKPFYAQLAAGEEHFDVDLGYKNESVYVRAKYLDGVSLAYSSQFYSMRTAGQYDPEKLKASKFQKIKAGSFEGQYDWGTRNSLYAIYNTLSYAPYSSGEASATLRQSAVAAFRIKDDRNPLGNKLFTQATYAYDPYTYAYNALQYLRNLYEQQIYQPTSVFGARALDEQTRNNFQNFARNFDPITSAVIGNMVRTLKADYRSNGSRSLAEAISTNRGSAYNLGFELGKVTFGGSLATSEFGKMLALQVAAQGVLGLDLVKATLSAPIEQGRGINLNLGMQKENFRLLGSYTNLDLVARGLANQIGDLRTKLTSYGAGVEYRKDAETNYFILFTKNRAGLTDITITDNPNERVSTLTGATAGMTIYSFNESGLRNSWTAGAFAEKITLADLQKQSDFYSRQYGIYGKMQLASGSFLSAKGGVEYYPGGKGWFAQINFRWFF